MKGSHPRPADRCPFVLRHSISQVISFMQLGMLCLTACSGYQQMKHKNFAYLALFDGNIRVSSGFSPQMANEMKSVSM